MYETRKWEDYPKLNVGRLNAYIKRIENKIYIIGGSKTDIFNPCHNTEEILDLDSIETGWMMHATQESICFKVSEVIVEIDCE